MNDEMEQIIKNQLAIMNVLYNMYQPTITKYNRNVDINNCNILLSNMKQTVNLLERTHKKK